MFTKKYIIGVGIGALLLSGLSSLAFADLIITPISNVDATGKVNSAMDNSRSQQMILQISAKGEALLRGTIDAIGTNSLTVKSWGGEWVVNILTSTQLMPGSDITQFKVGDFVGVQGTVNQQGAWWVIDAKLVRDWTAKGAIKENKAAMRTERHNNEQEIKDVIKTESPKNWQGVATNINVTAKSFTLTVDGVAYTVNLVTNATVVNKSFLTTSFSNMKEGDTVRVWGPVSSTTISAYVFRDVSL